MQKRHHTSIGLFVKIEKGEIEAEPTIDSMSFDFSTMTSLLCRYQEQFYCSQCKQMYHRKWFHVSNNRCFFCKRFVPRQVTYRVLLREIEWCFIQSGEDDKHEFYTNYINYLHNWCTYYHMYPTREDQRQEEELYEDLKN